MDKGTIITIMAFVLVFLFGVFSYYNGVTSWKKVTKFHIQIGILFLLTLSLNIFDIWYRNDSAKKDHLELINKINERYEASIDVFTPPRNLLNPVVTIDSTSRFYRISTTFINKGKGNAFNLVDIFKIVNIKDNIITADPTPKRDFSGLSKDDIFYPNDAITINSDFYKLKNDQLNVFLNGETFYCLRIFYSDTVSNNKSWTGVFNLSSMGPDKRLSYATREKRELILNYLDKNKLWEWR